MVWAFWQGYLKVQIKRISMAISRQNIHERIHLVASLCIALFLPVARLVPIFIIILLLNWIIEGDFRKKWYRLKQNNFALLFISFYLIHLIGLTYTTNLESGWFDVQVKLSLMFFPLILATRPFQVSDKQKIFRAFIIGCSASLAIMLSHASYIYFTTGQNDFFYESFSSFLIHPSYISMYLNLAVAWLILNLQRIKFSDKPLSFILNLFLIFFFSVSIFLLSSKLGIVTLVLIFIGFIVVSIITKRKYLIGFSALAVIVLSVFIVMKFVPEISGRINRAIDALTDTNVNEAEVESSAVRLLVWSASNELVADNLLTGVGTGDAKDELMKVYLDRGMTGAYKHELNAHNEYYQVFISLGIIGFILLLSNLYFPLVASFRNGNIIYLLFLCIIILNFLTESMFETQAGVMFYAFFNALLCFNSSKESGSAN